MHFTLDLRFAMPALVNVLLYLLLSSQGHLWDWDSHPLIKMTSLILGFLISYVTLSFLSLPLSLMLTIPNHQTVGFGNLRGFSIPLALTLLASFLFPPAAFWCACLICIGLFAPPWVSVVDIIKDILMHAMPVSAVSMRGDPQQRREAEETLESVLSSDMEMGDDEEADDYVLNEYQHDEDFLEIIMYGHA